MARVIETFINYNKNKITNVSANYTIAADDDTVNVLAETATVTVDNTLFNVGKKLLVRKIHVTQGEVAIIFTGGTVTKAALTSVTLNSDGDFWLVEKVTATRWDIIAEEQPNLVYGIEINEDQENPDLAVIYTDDAMGFTPATRTTNGSWGTTNGTNPLFKDIRPCLFKDGLVNYYLNPEDYTKKTDGTDSVLTGADGDVMLEIPKMWCRVNRSGNQLRVQVSRAPFSGARAYSHTRTTEGDRDFLYIGAYLGTTVSDSLRSISGTAEPTGSKTIGTFRTEARNKTNNGTGEYDLVSFYPLTLLQCLYLIRYKHLDSQTALGRGHVDSAVYAATGRTNTLGMYAGTTSGNPGYVKFAGIEDFYGNKFYWIDGVFNNSTRNVLTAFKSFNDTGSGYTNQGVRSSDNLSGFLKTPQGDTECGFIAKEVGSPASASTYYCDFSILNADRLARFGAGRGSSDDGAFYLRVNDLSANSVPDLGARLMYL